MGLVVNWHKDLIILLSIMLFAVILRLFFIAPMGTGDEISYASTALKIINGKPFIYPHHFSLRTGTIVPASVIMKIFGVSKETIFLWPLLCSIGSIMLVYFCAKRFFSDEKVASIAALLYAFIPLNAIYSTALTPEPVIEFFALASFFFYLVGAVKREGAGTKRRIALLLCGLTIGFGYLAKEPMMLMLAVFGIFWIIDSIKERKILWDYSFIVIGFLMVFFGEQAAYFAYTGKWFYRLTAVGSDIKTMLLISPHERFEARLSQYVRYMFLSIYQTGLFFYLFVISIIYLIFKKRLPLKLFLWFVIVYLYLQFGSGSLKTFLLLPKLAKYLSFLNPPLLLITAYFLSMINKNIANAGIALLLASSLCCIAFTNQILKSPVSQLSKPIAEYMINYPNGMIYTDQRLTGFLKFLTAGRLAEDRFVSYTSFDYLKAEKGKVDFRPVKGDWIIIGKEEYFRPHRGVVLEYPPAVNNPPAIWKEESSFKMFPSFVITIASKVLFFLDDCHVPKKLIGQMKDTISLLNEPKEIVIYQVQ